MRIKSLLGVGAALWILTAGAAYAVCYSQNSGQNCVWVGATRTWSFLCNGSWYTTTLTAQSPNNNFDWATAAVGHGTYWTRQWNENTCATDWNYYDCNSTLQYLPWGNVFMGYFRVTGTSCVQ